MNRSDMMLTMEKVFEECRELREAGQKEYAHEDTNAFANFDDDATAFGIPREVDLLIFANKHWRGVRAWARGHKSQRENVRGRINDLIVYLCLLRGMADETDKLDPATLRLAMRAVPNALDPRKGPRDRRAKSVKKKARSVKVLATVALR